MGKTKKLPEIHIGTSGWSYNHWKENFYPKEVKPPKWLSYYSGVFSTVEINTTFYHVPLVSTVKKWHETVPENFLFSIKASRYITHMKKLVECEESLDYFYESLVPFQNNAGPVLFQLPPSFAMDKEKLIAFIKLLTKEYRYVFEFRHASWFVEEIYEILTKHKIALCITDLNGKQSPEIVTTDFTYLRLHGPHKAYQGSYGTAKLKVFRKKMENWMEKGVSVYCYFDNDEKGYAIEDAKELQDMFAV